MNLAQFRNDKDLVAQWDEEMKTNKLLQLVIQTMEEAHPDRFGLEADTTMDVSPTMAGIQLGKSRGYSLYGGRLKMLTQPLTPQEMSSLPESEYLPEPEEKPEPKRRGRPPKRK